MTQPRTRPPFCEWCGERLDESAWFKSEMELAAFQTNSPLIDSNDSEVQPRGDQPQPVCTACRESLHENAQDIRDEAAHEKAMSILQRRILARLCVLLFGVVALSYLWSLFFSRSPTTR